MAQIQRTKSILIAIGVIGVGLTLWAKQLQHGGSGLGDIIVPELGVQSAAGQILFNRECATCHGKDAIGGDTGPPLIHMHYERGHHDDSAFVKAVQTGVKQHHWDFGDMPPQPQIDAEEIANIIAFVRAVQEANGIE